MINVSRMEITSSAEKALKEGIVPGWVFSDVFCIAGKKSSNKQKQVKTVNLDE